MQLTELIPFWHDRDDNNDPPGRRTWGALVSAL